jgi:branched-chain amino acid transport system permease protein
MSVNALTFRRLPQLPVWVINLALTAILAGLWPLGRVLEHQLNPYFLQILILVGINIMLAVSLNLVNGITGQFSLGHAGFMAVGAYAAGVLLRHYQPQGWEIPLVMLGVLCLGGVLAALAGLVVGIPTLRLQGDYLAIATLGFGEIINVVIINTESVGSFYVGGSAGLHGIPIHANFFWTFGAALICIVCVWRLAYSNKGKAFAAIREDEIAAGAMGVNTTYYKVAAFAIGAFFAGVAGGVSATWFGNLDPESFRFMRSIEIVAMVVLGGSGSITGAILAAVVLTWLPEQLRAVQEWRLVIYALVLILMMIFRPEGLLGNRELWPIPGRRRPGPSPTADPDSRQRMMA